MIKLLRRLSSCELSIRKESFILIHCLDQLDLVLLFLGDLRLVNVKALIGLRKLDLFVQQMDNKSIFFIGVIGDAMALGHFRITKDVCDCMVVEPHLTPSWDGCLLVCSKYSSICN
jgi:hypothetical protein